MGSEALSAGFGGVGRSPGVRLELFWAKVDRSGECWQWTGAVTGRGYGGWGAGGRSYVAHRLAYELLVGPIPAGLTIDHLCRNKLCMNPVHMEPVTNRENILRAKARTHCIHGHEYTPENNVRHREGGLKCRTCHNARRRVTAKQAQP